MLASVAFLTRIPVSARLDAADVARGAWLFPLVGAGIGAAVGGIADGLAGSLTSPLAAIVGAAAGAVLTGALHLDAVADTADALGAHTRDRALEIMRDHAIGAYGAVALVFALAAKIAALAVLASREDALRYAVCAASAARVGPVLLSSSLPYARATGGTGSALVASGSIRAILAVAVSAVFCLGLAGWNGAIVLAVVAGIVLFCGLATWRWLGGVTGDVLGATVELSEVAALVAAVALT